MFGELDGKPMERTLVETGDETLNNLFSKKLKASEISYVIPLYWQFR